MQWGEERQRRHQSYVFISRFSSCISYMFQYIFLPSWAKLDLDWLGEEGGLQQGAVE